MLSLWGLKLFGVVKEATGDLKQSPGLSLEVITAVMYLNLLCIYTFPPLDHVVFRAESICKYVYLYLS